MKQIPEIYKVYLEKIKTKESDGRVSTEWVRYILGFVFRIPTNKINLILKDMQRWDLIEMKCCKFTYLKQ
jgi:hypothetical protein